MPKTVYRPHKFKPEQQEVIAQANKMLEDYAARGYTLTVRQLFYQFVSRALIENTVPSYKRLGTIIDAGRLAGLIDWNHIEDRTRNLNQRGRFANPNEIIETAFYSYHLDRWATQQYRPEVHFEKEALAGIFERVCHKWDVPFFACRGYVSQSEMWRGAMRLRSYEDEGQQPVILHFGDHDPSGIDMTRDIRERMAMFGIPLDVERLALNMDQVDHYKPPPNPAKTTDSRFNAYMVQYGDESWELDALEPEVLSALVENAINGFRDADVWRKTAEREILERALLQTTSEHWGRVGQYLGKTVPDEIKANAYELREHSSYAHELEG